MKLNWTVDYQSYVREFTNESDGTVKTLRQLLPSVWKNTYIALTPRLTEICSISLGRFTYIYDDFASLLARGAVQDDGDSEARLVGVLGISCPPVRAREASRQRGWIGPTEVYLGSQWDKGHFMAHSVGGAVDGFELNVFRQRRDLNRGWSEEGRRYRVMETYCAQHPGTFCFSRPFYQDNLANPAVLEFGLVDGNGELWVERFNNEYNTTFQFASHAPE